MLYPVLQDPLRPVVGSLFDRPVGVNIERQVAWLYEQLLDTSKPMPAFFEGWASNSLHGQHYAVPTGYATVPPDSEGERIFSIDVTGVEGDKTLSGAGFNTTQGAGTWGCVIKHDDGTYGFYTASGITGSSITISPGLRSAATGKPLSSIGGAFNGQHYGLQATKALARGIARLTNGSGYRARYQSKLPANTESGWTKVGGNPYVEYQYAVNQFPNGGYGSYWSGRGVLCSYIHTAIPGLGVSHTAALTGLSGYVELFVGVLEGGGGPFRVRLLLDGIETYNQTFTAFTRVVVPYSNANTGTIEITFAGTAASAARFGDLTWWAYDRAAAWNDTVIQPNDKVVVLGDSWSARYSGGLGTEIAQAQLDAGGVSGSVATVAQGGMTSEWGLAQFDVQVAPLSPDVVVIEYFVNDINSFGDANYLRWLVSLYKLGLKCQQIGARPLFVMPLPTQSQGQSSSLGTWAEKLGAGVAR